MFSRGTEKDQWHKIDLKGVVPDQTNAFFSKPIIQTTVWSQGRSFN